MKVVIVYYPGRFPPAECLSVVRSNVLYGVCVREKCLEKALEVLPKECAVMVRSEDVDEEVLFSDRVLLVSREASRKL